MNVSLKWIVLALIAASTFINYIDRQTLALLAKPIQAELRIDEVGYANLVSLFLAAYTLGNLVVAWIVDKIGPRLALPAFVVWWSLANLMSGFAQNAAQMGATRFALGLGEVGNFVAAPALVRGWFPSDQRALGIGVYTAAAMFGATVSPPLLTSIGAAVGWRAAFWITGAIGLVWAVVWLLTVTAKRAAKHALPAEADADEPAIKATWLGVLKIREVWVFLLSTALTFPVWYFYLFWFPKYLTDERGLTLQALGQTSWIVYLAAGVGALVGGWASGRLIARSGMAPTRARLAVMGLVALVGPIGAINAFEPNLTISLALAALVAFCQMIWQTNLTSLPVDVFEASALPKVLGVMGLASGLCGIGTTYVIGFLVETVTYKPMFLVMACAYPIAWAIVASQTSLRKAPAPAMA